jgi:hypothetical protein
MNTKDLIQALNAVNAEGSIPCSEVKEKLGLAK